jgi:hypothetical protein
MPTSQRNRPISFVLDDQAQGEPAFALDLLLRPEDLTISQPSRVSVVQTLGGGWADSFGPGLSTINISGHTGWREDAYGQDGEARFLALRDQVFDQWHKRRQDAIDQGLDPADVRLLFADDLDSFAGEVVPLSFTLKRSRARPLLLQYAISLIVVDPDVGQSIDDAFGPTGDALQSAGLSSMGASIGGLAGAVSSVGQWVNTTLVAPLQSFVHGAVSLFNAVLAPVRAGFQVVGALVNTAMGVAQAGANLFRMVSSIGGYVVGAVAGLAGIAADFTSIWFCLKRAFRAPLSYGWYWDLYGASNCSSTAGGRPLSPLAGVNPFDVMSSAAPLGVSFTPAASAALAGIVAADPVRQAYTVAQVNNLAAPLAAGMVVAP